MDFTAKLTAISKLKTDCLILPVFADGKLTDGVQEADTLSGGAISKYLKLKDLTLKPGKCAWLNGGINDNISRALLVCLGKSADKSTAADLKTGASASANAIKSKQVKSAAWLVESFGEVSEKSYAATIAEAYETATYQYAETKTQNVEKTKFAKLVLCTSGKPSAQITTGLNQGKALGNGINVAREMGNLPANICTPSYLADYAQQLEGDGFSVKSLSEKQMEKLGMGSLLSVSAGSTEPAKLIVMEYNGADKKQAPTVLVGKGITFDTGGISIKPGSGMDEMKFDMCGAASVMGTMFVLKALKPKINVVGVIAAAENMPSGKATKPGDVVTSMSGQTIEILNTDAEGRLVLCDALTYVEKYKPKAVVDIATLTGACVIALGNFPSGLFANDQALADELLACGLKAQDKVWQMPLWDEYQKSLDSNFADMANIGGREGGSITAACFLARFTKKYKWAHLDIAGTAWKSGSQKGATGRPVGLLSQYLLGIYE